MDSTGTASPRELAHPPKPRLVFRVGVVGHRPNRLGQANLVQLGGVVRIVLAAVEQAVREFGKACELYSGPATPVLRALSPLAEGTDRLFADQALDLGWELCCVMPFHQAEYERDFAPPDALETESLSLFRNLLERADKAGKLTRFELDGNRNDAGAAYGAGGRVVLNQSDILIVVWDGKRESKRGGTEETLDDAQRRGVPVVWIDAQAPHAWQWLKPGQIPLIADSDGRAVPDGSGSQANVQRVVQESLAVPVPAEQDGESGTADHAEEPRRNLQRFYLEHQPRRTWSVVWRVFRDILGDSKFRRVSLSVKGFEAAVLDDWPEKSATPVARIVNTLRPFYAWPDKLAVLHSDRYRSAFVLVFLLAAGAVGMALLPVALRLTGASHGETASTAIELVAILVILIVVLLGRLKSWHQRWIDCRLAAELVRHLRLVAPVGGGRPFAHVPAHLATYGQPQATWMDWYARAVARDIGLPNVVVDNSYLGACLAHLHTLLGDQLKYHRDNTDRCHNVENRLHIAGLVLLSLTLAACVLHLLHLFLPAPMLTFVCGFCPALGAALAGIDNQGEFRRVARRSHAMQKHLRSLMQRVELLQKAIASPEASQGAFAPQVGVVAGDAASLLVAEVLDWRIVFLDRILNAA